ncbi:MAG TPA: hypothetical protein VNO21_19980 [Polyangiaceae bacterium]|nr:hypothetical protein [Polyangiaceae bacterium]
MLDFGIARLVEGREDLQRAGSTGPGMIIGTIGDMSPEQIRDEEIDARTDIFALGAVLCEMATGVPAFAGRGPLERMTRPCAIRRRRAAESLARSSADVWRRRPRIDINRCTISRSTSRSSRHASSMPSRA